MLAAKIVCSLSRSACCLFRLRGCRFSFSFGILVSLPLLAQGNSVLKPLRPLCLLRRQQLARRRPYARHSAEMTAHALCISCPDVLAVLALALICSCLLFLELVYEIPLRWHRATLEIGTRRRCWRHPVVSPALCAVVFGETQQRQQRVVFLLIRRCLHPSQRVLTDFFLSGSTDWNEMCALP